jgi:hypothetical protein
MSRLSQVYPNVANLLRGKTRKSALPPRAGLRTASVRTKRSSSVREILAEAVRSHAKA